MRTAIVILGLLFILVPLIFRRMTRSYNKKKDAIYKLLTNDWTPAPYLLHMLNFTGTSCDIQLFYLLMKQLEEEKSVEHQDRYDQTLPGLLWGDETGTLKIRYYRKKDVAATSSTKRRITKDDGAQVCMKTAS